MSSSSESRGELLSWVNDLLHTNYAKVEQMGSGAALCQIIDSIYGDVPMSKVCFTANQEYQFVNNFKVLQTAFAHHHIDKPIPVERLIKLKFQDNLEFMQWMKKFWDANYPGGSYDAIRRRGGPASSASGTSAVQPRPAAGLTRATSVHHQRPAAPTLTAPTTTTTTNGAEKTIIDLKKALFELEKERDFYFNKLRDIEIMTQKVADPTTTESLFFKQITKVLYATEDGFEIPDGGSLLGA